MARRRVPEGLDGVALIHELVSELANKLVGILHGILEHRSAYDDQHAWSNWLPTNELAA